MSRAPTVQRGGPLREASSSAVAAGASIAAAVARGFLVGGGGRGVDRGGRRVFAGRGQGGEGGRGGQATQADEGKGAHGSSRRGAGRPMPRASRAGSLSAPRPGRKPRAQGRL